MDVTAEQRGRMLAGQAVACALRGDKGGVTAACAMLACEAPGVVVTAAGTQAIAIARLAAALGTALTVEELLPAAGIRDGSASAGMTDAVALVGAVVRADPVRCAQIRARAVQAGAFPALLEAMATLTAGLCVAVSQAVSGLDLGGPAQGDAPQPG